MEESTLDRFFDYTSIAGFRFLHSRYPTWFRILSVGVLTGALALFALHLLQFIIQIKSNSDAIRHTAVVNNRVRLPQIYVSGNVEVISCTWFDGADCIVIPDRNFVRISHQPNSLIRAFEETPFVLIGSSMSFQMKVNSFEPPPELFFKATTDADLQNVADINEETFFYSFMISEIVRNDFSNSCNSTYCYVYKADVVSDSILRCDVLSVGADHDSRCIFLSFQRGVNTTSSIIQQYSLVQFVVDLGSALGLYFGFTVLSLFEVIVCIIFGRSTNLMKLKPAPPNHVLYQLATRREFHTVASRKAFLKADFDRQVDSACHLPKIVY